MHEVAEEKKVSEFYLFDYSKENFIFKKKKFLSCFTTTIFLPAPAKLKKLDKFRGSNIKI